jgi:FKBP-type peptidyl-prolyl cis-trans isomerase
MKLRNFILLVALLVGVTAPTVTFAEGEYTRRSATSGAAATSADKEKEEKKITGPELLAKFQHTPKVEIRDGFYYHEVFEGTGREAIKGHVVYVMARGFDANGEEMRLGSDNHTHPDAVSEEHEHGLHAYAGRWFIHGYGGGNLNLGTDKMNNRFYEAMSGMKENGKRLIFIDSEHAYGEEGYEGHDYKVKPNTDLLIEISLIRVRHVVLPEDRGLSPVHSNDHSHDHSHEHGDHTHDDHSHEHHDHGSEDKASEE